MNGDKCMNQDYSEAGMGNELLTRIQEGMAVYDVRDEKIGKVDDIYFGTVTSEEDQTGTGSITTSTAGRAALKEDRQVSFAFGGTFDDPELEEETIRNRYLRQGYVRVDAAGIFSKDFYVTPDLIEGVTGDAVRLKVARDEIKRKGE
jgi:hypothetical protein